MTHIKKPSPDTGKVAALAVERGKLEQKRKDRNKHNQKTITILTYVRTLAPISSRSSALSPKSGTANN